MSRELVAKIRRQLIEAGQVPNDPGRVGSDGKTYSAGREPSVEGPESPAGPAAGGRRPARAARPAPPGTRNAPRSEPARPRVPKSATSEWPCPSAGTVTVPTIDEMLALMARQVMEVITWTQADGFTDAYRTASANARGLFQTAVIKLAARADQLAAAKLPARVRAHDR